MLRSCGNEQQIAFGWMCQPAERLALALITPIVVFLALVNLAGYPTITGWDEGIFLQFAGNLVRHGEYATNNGGVFERMMPLCSVGPTVIAPTGLALLLSGNSLAAARAVVVVYLFIAVGGIYLLTRHLAGWVSAIASIFLFLTAGYQAYDTLWLGRQVLGEIPALAFGFLGLWAWIKSWHGNSGWLVASFFLLALAVITKNQLVWLLGPGFALTVLIDRLHHRQLRWYHALVPPVAVILGFGACTLLALWIVGPSGQAGYQEAVDAAASVTLHSGPQRWLENAKYYGRMQWLIALATIGYGFYRSRERSLEGLGRLAPPVFASVALVGFIGLSVAWPRSLHSVLTFVALCNALLIGDLAGWAGTRWKPKGLWTVATLALAVALVAGPRLVQNIRRITTINDLNAERFAALFDQQVPAGSSVLNWEWEIEFYSQRSFVHPSYQLLQALFDQMFNQRDDPILDQPRFPSEIEYLITGPFDNRTQVFTSALGQRRHRLLFYQGPYYLYQFY